MDTIVHDCFAKTSSLSEACQGVLWDQMGCTGPAPLHELSDKSPKEIQAYVTSLTQSGKPGSLKQCFSQSTATGYGSEVLVNFRPSPCQTGLQEDGEVIDCPECKTSLGREEGKWFYRKGYRYYIPKCDCPLIYSTLGLPMTNPSVCSASSQQLKPLQAETDPCRIADAWNDINTPWYSNGKETLGAQHIEGYGQLTDKTIFYVQGTQIYIPVVKGGVVDCKGVQTRVCDPTKVHNCDASGKQCLEHAHQAIPPLIQAKTVSPSCFYSIPVNEGSDKDSISYRLYHDPITLHPLDCQSIHYFKQKAFDGIAYVGNTLYVAQQNQIFAMSSSSSGDRYTVKTNWPRPLTSIFPGCPTPIDTMSSYVDLDQQTYVIIAKGNTLIRYKYTTDVPEASSPHFITMATNQLTDYVPGLQRIDLLAYFGGYMYFFLRQTVYMVNWTDPSLEMTQESLHVKFPELKSVPQALVQIGDRYYAFLDDTVYESNVMFPENCSKCYSGKGKPDGGIELDHGICRYYCSKWLYCGITPPYQTGGSDCREIRPFQITRRFPLRSFITGLPLPVAQADAILEKVVAERTRLLKQFNDALLLYIKYDRLREAIELEQQFDSMAGAQSDQRGKINAERGAMAGNAADTLLRQIRTNYDISSRREQYNDYLKTFLTFALINAIFLLLFRHFSKRYPTAWLIQSPYARSFIQYGILVALLYYFVVQFAKNENRSTMRWQNHQWDPSLATYHDPNPTIPDEEDTLSLGETAPLATPCATSEYKNPCPNGYPYRRQEESTGAWFCYENNDGNCAADATFCNYKGDVAADPKNPKADWGDHPEAPTCFCG